MEYSKAKLPKKERFKAWLNKHSFYVATAIFLAIILAVVAIVATLSKPKTDLEVNAPKVEWGMPVAEVDIIKDYSATELQECTAFKRWEIHKAIDFKLDGTNKEVRCVFKGTIISVTNGLIDGNVVVIEHEGGVRSIYGSLADDIKVKPGDVVEKGTLIGYGGTSAARESDMGPHLHFAMQKNNELINPRDYVKFA